MRNEYRTIEAVEEMLEQQQARFGTAGVWTCDSCERPTVNRPVEVKYRVGEEVHTGEVCVCDDCAELAWEPDSWEGM